MQNDIQIVIDKITKCKSDIFEEVTLNIKQYIKNKQYIVKNELKQFILSEAKKTNSNIDEIKKVISVIESIFGVDENGVIKSTEFNNKLDAIEKNILFNKKKIDEIEGEIATIKDEYVTKLELKKMAVCNKNEIINNILDILWNDEDDENIPQKPHTSTTSNTIDENATNEPEINSNNNCNTSSNNESINNTSDSVTTDKETDATIIK